MITINRTRPSRARDARMYRDEYTLIAAVVALCGAITINLAVRGLLLPATIAALAGATFALGLAELFDPRVRARLPRRRDPERDRRRKQRVRTSRYLQRHPEVLDARFDLIAAWTDADGGLPSWPAR